MKKKQTINEYLKELEGFSNEHKRVTKLVLDLNVNGMEFDDSVIVDEELVQKVFGKDLMNFAMVEINSSLHSKK